MRLRLFHTLSLMLLALVGAAVLAMAAVLAWNLRNGFSDYLAARDMERLELFTALVAQRVAEVGGQEGVTQGRLRMPTLLREFAVQEGVDVRRLPSDPFRPDAGGVPPPVPQGRPGPEAGEGAGPPRRPVGPNDEAFGARVEVVALDGDPLLGPPLSPGPTDLLQRPLVVGGHQLGWVRMRKALPAPGSVATRFLRQQYLGIAGVAAAALTLALLAAAWLAARWVRPLLAMQAATARMAQGALDVRLTDLRHDEIGDLQRNVNQMAQGLQRLEGARRRWLADLSHELRTPLTVLRGEIEALQMGARTLDGAALQSLQDEVLRMARLVDDLHLLALSDLKTLPCQFEDADALVMVRAVVQRFAGRASRAGLQLRAVLPEGASLPVQWDAARIDQVLANLLDNSLRYTRASGEVCVTVSADHQQLCLSVDDSAPGVSEADRARLFEPLFRVDTARGRADGSGSGLGLAICEAIVRAHRGSIQAHASALGGLQLRIELPLSQETEAP
jgi:two-component system, OmpR family, sensor histidine kinase BaeS